MKKILLTSVCVLKGKIRKHKILMSAMLLGLTVVVQADYNTLMQLSHQLKEKSTNEKKEAIAFAKQKGIPVRKVYKTGQIIEIEKIVDGIPLYLTTCNEDAAISTNTHLLRDTPYLLTGDGYNRLGMWDGGAVRRTHVELGTDKVFQIDGNTTIDDHPTHVAGTLIASGIETSARGMASEATLLAYDWVDDVGEMADAAASGMEISNHSYSSLIGWNDDETDWRGNLSISSSEAFRFGYYSDVSKDFDTTAYVAKNYLIVMAAGNDRNDIAPSFFNHSHNGSGSFNDEHNADGFDDGGYDTIGGRAIAKNVLTVGAVDDVSSYSSANSVDMSSFSGWGPADDGRIKPDIVGNGVGVYSSVATGDNDYEHMSGTSMAAPNVTGSLSLLQQYYKQLHNDKPMWSSTLKALVIHSAREAGADTGPDYQFGWGLLNSSEAGRKIKEDSTKNRIDELTLYNGGTYTRKIVIGEGVSVFKATIVWTDPAGIPVARALDPSDKMLVNDLNLRVSKDGTTYYPWSLDKDNPSVKATNTGVNDVDNVEQVYIVNPPSGTYTITVDHERVLSNLKQNFSIVLNTISDETIDTINDFSKNGSNDLVLHNSDTGAVKIWNMSGTTRTGATNIVTESNTNLLVKAFADMNNDGHPDIVLHNAESGMVRIWTMVGTTKVGNKLSLFSSNTNLNIIGAGDFTGDGNVDLVVHNSNTGALVIWEMNEKMKKVKNISVLTSSNTNLKPVAVGDLNADGKPDILLRNSSTGVLRAWLMNWTVKIGNEEVATSSNTNLKVRGLLDIDGDGQDDILWQNMLSGTVLMWKMNGITKVGSNRVLGYNTDLAWKVGAGLDDDFARSVNVPSFTTGGYITPGESYWYSFTVSETTRIIIRTYGTTDTYGHLYDSSLHQITEHDDIDWPQNPNFRINRTFSPGTYYIKVRGYSSSTEGSYALRLLTN